MSHSSFTLFLHILGQELKLNILGVDESGMALVLRVDIMFDLCHGEFTVRGQTTRYTGKVLIGRIDLPNSEKTLTGRDFVSETSTDLSTRERYTAVVELQKALEVDEMALGGFGPQVAAKRVCISHCG